MVDQLTKKLADCIFNFVSENGKKTAASFIQNAKEKKELKDTIQSFLDDFQENDLQNLSLDEEFDFGGFSEFLFSKQNRLEEYFYADKPGQRDAVLEKLRDDALKSAKPRGQSGRRLVLGCLDAVLATFEHILKNRVALTDLFLAARTTEQVRLAVNEIVSEHAERLQQHIDYRGSFAELVDNVVTAPPDNTLAYHHRHLRPPIVPAAKKTPQSIARWP